MPRFLIVPVFLLASAGVFNVATPARAEEYPVCRSSGGYKGLRCDFANLDQCRATTMGTGGSCVTNPAYISSANTSMSHRGAGRRRF
jgi:hypothetical protein